jgi:hypothetical protein
LTEVEVIKISSPFLHLIGIASTQLYVHDKNICTFMTTRFVRLVIPYPTNARATLRQVIRGIYSKQRKGPLGPFIKPINTQASGPYHPFRKPEEVPEVRSEGSVPTKVTMLERRSAKIKGCRTKSGGVEELVEVTKRIRGQPAVPGQLTVVEILDFD